MATPTHFSSEFFDPNKILFFNYDAIADASGVVQKWHQPVKHGPMLQPQREYEGGMTLPVAIYPDVDGQRIVCRYSCLNSAAKYPHLKELDALALSCVAHSRDGLHWDRPNLGLHAFRGSKDNNIAGLPEIEFKMIGPTVADHRETDPARKYKGIALQWKGKPGVPDFAAGSRCFVTYTSPDGVSWENPRAIPQFIETGDTSGLLWDERRQLYCFTTRPVGYWVSDQLQPFLSRPVKKKCPDGRWIGLSTSKDFIDWTPLDLILVRDAMDEPGIEFYCAVIFPYGNQYLGLLRRFDSWHGTMDTELVHSFDGVRWQRAKGRQAFLGFGELGSFDWCFGDLVNCKPIRSGNQILFFYEGRNHVHAPHAVKGTIHEGSLDAAMGLATLRLDGFVSIESGRHGGKILTEPLPLAGRQATLNARCVADGQIRIEVLDDEMKPLTPQPLVFRGDDCAWPLAGEQGAALPRTNSGMLRLQIELENAAIYSIGG